MPQVLFLLLPSLLLFAIIAYFIWESLSLWTLVATEPQTQTRHPAAARNGMMIPWPQMVWPKLQTLVHIPDLCMGSNGNLEHTVHNRASWSWHMDPDMVSLSCLVWSTSLFWVAALGTQLRMALMVAWPQDIDKVLGYGPPPGFICLLVAPWVHGYQYRL